MGATSRVWTVLIGICASLGGVRAAETPTATQWAVYKGLEPGAFIKQWLLCDPFPVFEGAPRPEDVAAQREAFDMDLMPAHGGE